MMELEILYEDQDLLVINKPANLIVHRSKISTDTISVMSILRDQLGGDIHLIHRLDRPTSGILLLAKNTACLQRANELFQEKHPQKEYTAMVRGHFPEQLTIDRALQKEKTGIMQSACTEARVLAYCELPIPNKRYNTSRYSLVLAEPKTGRNHQIRRHLAGAGYPIVGDTTHGDTFHNKAIEEYSGIQRLYLHAGKIRLPHPGSGKWMTITAPLPEDFTITVKKMFPDFKLN